jgi:hypothetical protein
MQHTIWGMLHTWYPGWCVWGVPGGTPNTPPGEGSKRGYLGVPETPIKPGENRPFRGSKWGHFGGSPEGVSRVPGGGMEGVCNTDIGDTGDAYHTSEGVHTRYRGMHHPSGWYRIP